MFLTSYHRETVISPIFKIIVRIGFFEFSGVIIAHNLGYLHGDDPYERKNMGRHCLVLSTF